MARKVAAIIPPMTPVPTERRAPAPAPVEKASSITPKMKASEVIRIDRKSTRLNSSHGYISYAVFCLKKKKKNKLSAMHSKSVGDGVSLSLETQYISVQR